MTRNCWRVMACLLTLSLGGLVVCADERQPQPAPIPTAVSNPIVSPDASGTTTIIISPTAPPVQVAQKTDPLLVPPPVESPPIQKVADIPPPPPIAYTPTVPAIAPASPQPVGTPYVPKTETPATLASFPWKLNIQMIAGMTQLDLTHGDDVHMRILCERLELQTPGGGLRATGKVSVSGPAIEARCERISVAWQTGHIALEGKVRVLCQNNQQKTEIGAEAACLKLTGVGNGIEFTANDVTRQIIPVRND